jgi:prefoldin beta subunit
MDDKEAIQQLSLTEQSLDQFSMQKKQFSSQLMEIDASLDALGTSPEAFKLIGNLMVKQSSDVLRKDLESRKEVLQVRVQTIEKQEEKLRSKVKELQNVVLKQKKGRE